MKVIVLLMVALMLMMAITIGMSYRTVVKLNKDILDCSQSMIKLEIQVERQEIEIKYLKRLNDAYEDMWRQAIRRKRK